MRPLSLILARILDGLITVYQYGISPILGPRCRYQPTCSSYARDAIARHGAVRGVWLALRRIGRCHPWGGHGYDPVPDTQEARPATDDMAKEPL